MDEDRGVDRTTKTDEWLFAQVVAAMERDRDVDAEHQRKAWRAVAPLALLLVVALPTLEFPKHMGLRVLLVAGLVVQTVLTYAVGAAALAVAGVHARKAEDVRVFADCIDLDLPAEFEDAPAEESEAESATKADSASDVDLTPRQRLLRMFVETVVAERRRLDEQGLAVQSVERSALAVAVLAMVVVVLTAAAEAARV